MKLDKFEVIDFNQEDDEERDTIILERETLSALGSKSRRDGKEKDEDEKEDWKSEFKSTISTLLIAIAVVVVLRLFVIVNAVVPTGSMENTILPGDHLLGLRSTCFVTELERGDIIFFPFPDDEKQNYVKRIIGLPGEKVEINNGKIYINDSEVPLEEPYLKEEWVTSTGPYEFQVPEDGYLVLGDNRNSSADARYWRNTYVTEDKIIGKAIFTYFPFNRWGFVE